MHPEIIFVFRQQHLVKPRQNAAEQRAEKLFGQKQLYARAAQAYAVDKV